MPGCAASPILARSSSPARRPPWSGASYRRRRRCIELGWHRLRDVAALEQVFQLAHPALRVDFPHFASADTDSRLPASLSSFVGRTAETAEVKRLMKLSRLLTLTGSGGVGKSRLAFQVVADLLAEYPDDAFIVDLAPLANPALVPQHVLSALGVAEEPGRSHVDTLVSPPRRPPPPSAPRRL